LKNFISAFLIKKLFISAACKIKKNEKRSRDDQEELISAQITEKSHEYTENNLEVMLNEGSDMKENKFIEKNNYINNSTDYYSEHMQGFNRGYPPSDYEMQYYSPMDNMYFPDPKCLQNLPYYEQSAPKNPKELKKKSKQRICSNCHTVNTPSWRRGGNGKALLCNACGLYQKLHNRPRPYSVSNEGKTKALKGGFERVVCVACSNFFPIMKIKSSSSGAICEDCFVYYRNNGVQCMPQKELDESAYYGYPNYYAEDGQDYNDAYYNYLQHYSYNASANYTPDQYQKEYYYHLGYEYDPQTNQYYYQYPYQEENENHSVYDSRAGNEYNAVNANAKNACKAISKKSTHNTKPEESRKTE